MKKIPAAIGYFTKAILWGALVGFTILFFMPDSKMPFNWQSANQAWRFYQSHSKQQSEDAWHRRLAVEDISFADAVDKALPSVVEVNVYRQGLRQSDKLGPDEKIKDVSVGIGSGVILSEQGYIVTNYHVIAEADDVSINFPDGRRRYVEIVGFDRNTDIAVLKTDLKELNSASLATSRDVKTGDIVMAIGSPFALNKSVSLGIVSAITFNPMLFQTDAAINTGNSGGALINSRGEVIGINQSKLSSRGGGQTGVNFAIPIDLVKKIVEDLIMHGHVRRNWLGINAVELLEYNHKQKYPQIKFGSGFFVRNIDPKSPAQKANIRVGDFINRFEGSPISGVTSFYKLFYNLPIGKLVEIELIRNGELKTVQVQLEELPHDENS